MNRCLQGTHEPEWMTEGKNILIQKDPSKETTTKNYGPITCLSMMWEILTAQIRKEIYYSLTSRDCSLRNRKDGTKDPEAQQSYLRRPTHPKCEQDQTEKSSYGLD